jgi:hypothetical protein
LHSDFSFVFHAFLRFSDRLLRSPTRFLGLGAVLRLRGLPWDATKEVVQRFLSPVTQVDTEDIMLVRNLRGDAYVIVRDAEAMQKAGSLHRQKVCHCCVVALENELDWK